MQTCLRNIAQPTELETINRQNFKVHTAVDLKLRKFCVKLSLFQTAVYFKSLPVLNHCLFQTAAHFKPLVGKRF
jgi:hypothetical protein